MSGQGKLGDRGGSREGRGKSLNKIKRVKYAVEKGKSLAGKPTANLPKFSPPPPPLTLDRLSTRYIDVSANLCSRSFHSDFQLTLRRFTSFGGGAVVVPLTLTQHDGGHLEDDIKVIQQYRGEILFNVRITHEVIQRGNMNVILTDTKGTHSDGPSLPFSLDSKMSATFQSFAVQPQCVAVGGGVDFSREVGTHAAQMKILQCVALHAYQWKLPLIVSSKDAPIANLLGALDEVSSAIRAHGGSSEEKNDSSVSAPTTTTSSSSLPIRTAFHSAITDESDLRMLVSRGVFIVVNGEICDVHPEVIPDTQPPQYQLVGTGLPLLRLIRGGHLPLSHLLVATDSPNITPQNIDDSHIRSQRNEPSNIAFIFKMLASALKLPQEEIEKVVLDNSRSFFDLSHQGEVTETISIPSTTSCNPQQNPKSNSKPSKQSKPKKNPREQDEKGSSADSEEEEEEHLGGRKTKKKVSKGNHQSSSEEDHNDGESDDASDNVASSSITQMASKPEPPRRRAKGKGKKKDRRANFDGGEDDDDEEVWIPLPNQRRNNRFQLSEDEEDDDEEQSSKKNFEMKNGVTVEEGKQKATESKSKVKRDGGPRRPKRSDEHEEEGGMGLQLEVDIDEEALQREMAKMSVARESKTEGDVVSSSSVNVKGPRSIAAEFELLEAQRTQEEEMNRMLKKDSEKLRKQNKKVKKMLRDDQRGNFTEFRNKNLTAKKTKKEEE